MPNPKPSYPTQFREQMVDLVLAGKKPAELAKEFGCHPTSIRDQLQFSDFPDHDAQSRPHSHYVELQ